MQVVGSAVGGVKTTMGGGGLLSCSGLQERLVKGVTKIPRVVEHNE